MADKRLFVRGAGIVTDGYADMVQFARDHAARPSQRLLLKRVEILDPAASAGDETLPRLALGALHQAWTMAAPGRAGGDDMGLIFASDWGMIDATTAYLETMFDAEGRYASPRHFSRSVYSAAASLVAIHFQIHGPCLTLAFDQREDPVVGALRQAYRLLAAKRCGQVSVVWAEQGGAIAEDLARRASTALGRREYDRYVQQGVGQGAMGLLLADAASAEDFAIIDLDALPARLARSTGPGKPFPMDGATSLLASLCR